MSRTPLRRAGLAALACILMAAPLAAAGLDVADVADATYVPAVLKLSEEQVDLDDYAIPLHVPVPADSTGIGPGSRLTISMAGGLYQCTANFIWKDQNDKLYLGSAGHCFVPEGKRGTHGPGADYNASGTAVGVCISWCSLGAQASGATRLQIVKLGPVAYARQTLWSDQLGEDFGVVEIPPEAYPYIRTTMPVFGGPFSTGVLARGDIACHFGHGTAVGASWPTQARAGVGLSSSAGPGEWRAALAAAPGDSGSALQTCTRDTATVGGQTVPGLHGNAAIGILTHLSPTGPVVGTTMAKAAQMATEAGLTLTPVYVYP